MGFLSLIVLGGIVGDVLAHPKGTAAGLNGLNSVLKTSFSTALGGKKVAG
jgi:hypothetical protein